jgi:coenzyme F420-reducing hydrogenase beta subunit
MRFDGCGRFGPVSMKNAPDHSTGARVCPFSDQALSEDALAAGTLRDCRIKDGKLGYYLSAYAGYVRDGQFRTQGSSGGLVSWIACELLQRGLADAVLHVKQGSGGGQPLFCYGISRNRAEVMAGAKSKYYPVELSKVLNHVRASPGRYVIVGVPCFIKAVRLLASQEAVFQNRIKFYVGIFCGHLKSTAFAEMCAWQCGVAPSELQAIDFRTKRPGHRASDYAVTVTGRRGGRMVTVTKPIAELFGSNWGFGLFKYKACDFCDDVVAETADISFGDAWLPEYESDSQGTNAVVVRSRLLDSILAEAKQAGRVHLEPLSAQRVVESQAAGFRHRGDGLAYRLALEDALARWHPNKRVASSSVHLSEKLRRIHDLRQELREASHVAFARARQAADFNEFLKVMRPLTKRYLREYEPPLPYRALGKVRRSVAAVCRRLGGR